MAAVSLALTAREREIAVLLFEGKSNAEIAGALFIGLSTVKKHISAVLEKMNVKSRTEFVAAYGLARPSRQNVS